AVGETSKLIEGSLDNAEDIANNGQGSSDRSTKNSSRKKVKINKATKQDVSDEQDNLSLNNINSLSNIPDEKSVSLNGKVSSQKKKHNIRTTSARRKNMSRKSSHEEDDAKVVSENVAVNSPHISIEEHKSKANGNLTPQANEPSPKGTVKKESPARTKKRRTKVPDQEILEENLKVTNSPINQEATLNNGISSPQSPTNESGRLILHVGKPPGDDFENKEENESINIATPKTIEGDEDSSPPSATPTRPIRNSTSAQKGKSNVAPIGGRKRSPSSRARRSSSRMKSRSSPSRGRSRGVKATMTIDELDSEKEYEMSTSQIDRGESLGPSQSKPAEANLPRSGRRRTKIHATYSDEEDGLVQTDELQEPQSVLSTSSRGKVRKGNKESNNSSITSVKQRTRKKTLSIKETEPSRARKKPPNKIKTSDAESSESDSSEKDSSKERQDESSTDDGQDSGTLTDSNLEQSVVLDPFGGKLTPEEADTSKTIPDQHDKAMFESAKIQVEAKMQPREEITMEIEDQSQVFADATPKIRTIRFGDWEIDTWFVAPYPEEYSVNSVLHICEFCLKYMKSEYIADRHKLKCPMRNPPGDEIYRDNAISIFEVDGRKNKIYCQNLCLLAKMFLDHKTLYYDVEPFLFYVMTESNETGCHFVGYFSKEKRSPLNYNVSCILTLPIHQRKGYGNLLIEFSYLLSKKENKTGSPEKPLSDLGLLSYRYYWRNVLFEELSQPMESLSIQELSHRTSMTVDDIIATLQINNMIEKNKSSGTYCIIVKKDVIEGHLQKVSAKGYPRIKPENLRWTPFILTRALGLRTNDDQEEIDDGVGHVLGNDREDDEESMKWE
ncbi:13012_t:CDS:2, partial [Acaulospora colombiana]